MVRMMKRIQFAPVLFCILLLLSSCSINGSSSAEKYFEEGEFEFVGPLFAGNRIVPDSLSELEQYYCFGFDDNPDDSVVIGRCKVAGPGINRIIEPSIEEMDYSKTYGENHVLTPIILSEIYYAGNKVDIKPNEEAYLIEPYFYITESAKDYYKAFGGGKIYTYEYTPLKQDVEYIIYMRLREDDVYDYNDAVILDLCGRQEAVYCIGDEEKAKQVVRSDDNSYWNKWKEVIRKYVK